MDKQKQKAIEHHNAALMVSMDPLALMDNLRAGLLSLMEKESIKESHTTRRDRNRELISILVRKREELEPFEGFLEALKKTDASHAIMAEAILKTYKHGNGATEFVKVSRTPLSPTEETKYDLQIAQQSLKEMYLTRFQEVRPFSLPFTFDIENTWVSLALKEEKKDSQATEDHAKLLEQAFKKAKLLIVEGDPATGKTSLMRRLAYEWAKPQEDKRESVFMQLINWIRRKLFCSEEREEIKLLCYDLVLYAEFREVREKIFESIAELILYYSKKFLTEDGYENLKELMNNEKFCKEYRILVLLDGYDESSLEKQCSELNSYIIDKTIKKAVLFNIVVTTRKGYLSMHRGVKGRLVFAEVLGFTTMMQKEKYIFKHFLSQEIDNKQNIAAVQSLLNNNENMNKLAETPLFLTFICLVHERIVDGTLLELYCNIIWWLIDRHQQDFPDRDIPSLFGLLSDCNDKFETIQDHYLHFPQLHCLGKMALDNIEENVFKPSDCAQYNVQPIIEQVGLLRKESNHDNSFKLVTSFFFPHRTIQEFLAAFNCLCSNDATNEWLISDSKLNTSEDGGMNEFSRFLFRIALSDKIPVQAEKRKYYFERITDIRLNITFDTFTTSTGFNYKLLYCLLSQCTNVQKILLDGELDNARHELNDTADNESAITSKIVSSTLLSFSNLIKLHTVAIWYCAFEADTELSFTNCPSLKKLSFKYCTIESSTNLRMALPAIDTVQFYSCTIGLATWHSIMDQIRNSSVKFLQLSADFIVKETYSEFLHHLQKCERIQQIHLKDVYLNGDYILNHYESVTANLALTAQKLPGLTTITLSDENGKTLHESRRLSERKKERINKAGQERNPDFFVKYEE